MGKYRLLSNQLNQLKEEILSKEKQYTKDAQERKKVARYNDKQKQSILEIKKQIESSDKMIKT
jgi:septal ring factor EnvC (AmiA/AmiB activator)